MRKRIPRRVKNRPDEPQGVQPIGDVLKELLARYGLQFPSLQVAASPIETTGRRQASRRQL